MSTVKYDSAVGFAEQEELSMTVDLQPCPCGHYPQIMINQAFDAYAMCPECGAKGPSIPFPKEGMLKADTFVALLDGQRIEAALSWNASLPSISESHGTKEGF